MITIIKKSLSKWIAAALVLIVGIVCIVAGATNDGGAFDVISLTTGIIFVVSGAVGIVLAIAATIVLKKPILAIALGSGLVLAFGIFVLVRKDIAPSIIGYIVTFIPYILLVLGSIMILNLAFTIVYAVKQNIIKSSLGAIIFGGLIGVAGVVLGALGIGNNPVIPNSAQLIIFGIMILLVAILIALATFVKVPNVVDVVTIKSDDK